MPSGFWRKLRLGLPTLLGVRPQGFFIPYRYAGQIRQPPRYDIAAEIFAAARPVFAAALGELDVYAADLKRIGETAPAPQPRWGQSWFATLDAAILYGMVRTLRPRRLVEVGSGHSTRFAARAIADGRLATHHVAIDPAPRADCSRLPVDLRRAMLNETEPDLFATLAAGDILFVDSSHILMPGTDVDQLFNRILPALPPGVLVHIHDIFLPDDYPAGWHWRGYNEQLAILPLLAAGAYRPLFASRYVQSCMQNETAASLVATLPASSNLATSLWLEKV
ncbi:class I SAM-dependent methyltransferase [Dongia sp.]|uniref:class I SAM-dependent methyltransferase n=1 Tax=Dongia sp. TaxID=1977262 RepID=UPI0035AEA3D7